MKKWWKRPRTIVVDGEVYRYSLLDRPECRELRVYRERERQPALRLRLSWLETWGIDLFRPKMVACVIRWQAGQAHPRPAVLRPQEEPSLLQILVDLSFSPEEWELQAWFLEKIAASAHETGGDLDGASSYSKADRWP